MNDEQEIKMYGNTEQQMKLWMDSEMFAMHGTKMVLMSMLSDAQELVAFGADPEKTRQLLNRIKYVVSAQVK